MSTTLDGIAALLRTMLPAHRHLAEAHRIEASELVRRAAEPAVAGEHAKALITRAAQRLGFGFRRTRTFWYQEVKRIDSWEMDVMRNFKLAKRKRR